MDNTSAEGQKGQNSKIVSMRVVVYRCIPYNSALNPKLKSRSEIWGTFKIRSRLSNIGGRQCIPTMEEDDIENWIQLFNLNEVIVNKTRHIYSNKHTIILEDEINKLLEKYHTSIDKLPLILYNDPMVKYIGANRGDVIKIERISKSTGIYYYYRLCV